MDLAWIWFIGIVVGALILIIAFLLYVVCTEDDGDYEPLIDGGRAVPRDYLNDEESLRQLAEEFDFTSLLPEEQLSYLAGQEFTVTNPPDFSLIRGKSFRPEDDILVRDMGVHAWWFEPDLEESRSTNASESTPLLADADTVRDPGYVVRDKTEVVFRCGQPYRTATAVMNLAMPLRHRVYADTVYFEAKIMEISDSPVSHFAIGLVTEPYPKFRLPGYQKFLIAYESTGNLKINKPFPTPLQQHQGDNSQYNNLVLPPLNRADVVGFGYTVSLGTIFITRNGRKVLDVMKGCWLDLYPAIGCFSCDATFQVNIGQMGFVWIEANVRKYGFISTTDSRKLSGERGAAALPRYSLDENGDKLLDKGEELPPRYPTSELDFFGRTSTVAEGCLNEKTLTTRITHDPEEVMDLRERLYEAETGNSTPKPVNSKPAQDDGASTTASIRSLAPATTDASTNATTLGNDAETNDENENNEAENDEAENDEETNDLEDRVEEVDRGTVASAQPEVEEPEIPIVDVEPEVEEPSGQPGIEETTDDGTVAEAEPVILEPDEDIEVAEVTEVTEVTEVSEGEVTISTTEPLVPPKDDNASKGNDDEEAKQSLAAKAKDATPPLTADHETSSPSASPLPDPVLLLDQPANKTAKKKKKKNKKKKSKH